jgi:hypothetical protein
VTVLIFFFAPPVNIKNSTEGLVDLFTANQTAYASKVTVGPNPVVLVLLSVLKGDFRNLEVSFKVFDAFLVDIFT